jgi:hypothetical protein
MDKSHNSLPQTNLTWWRFLPYALFGIVAFSLTSATSLPSWLKSYLMLVEIPLGMLAIYFTLPKLVKFNKNQHKL